MQGITLEQDLYPLLVGITNDLLFLMHLFFNVYILAMTCLRKTKNIFLAIKLL